MSDNTEVRYRDAVTGEFVDEQYAEEHPDTTVRETIELSDQDMADVAKLYSVPDGEDLLPETVNFHPILHVWKVILEPVRQEVQKKVTPQWASRIVASYRDIAYNDMNTFRDSYYAKIEQLLDILLEEIATDDECLTYGTPEEDVEENRRHYLNLLRDWQKAVLGWEIAWTTTDPDAAIELAAISEVHKAVFGPTGLTQYLENIKLELTEDDQNELAAELGAMKEGS